MPRARGCRGDSGPVGPVGPAPAHPPEHGGSELSDGHGGVRVRPCVEIVGLTGQVAPELLRLVLAAATLWTDDQVGASAGASAGGAVRPRRRLTGQGLRGGAVGWVGLGLGLDGEGVGKCEQGARSAAPRGERHDQRLLSLPGGGAAGGGEPLGPVGDGPAPAPAPAAPAAEAEAAAEAAAEAGLSPLAPLPPGSEREGETDAPVSARGRAISDRGRDLARGRWGGGHGLGRL